MSELTQEQFEQLPEFVKGDYQEVDGVYKHSGVLKLKTSLNEVDAKYKGQIGEYETKLSSYEETNKAEIEQARKDALEQAKSKGEVGEIERLHAEQMADLEKRVAERVRGEVETEFSLKSAKKDAQVFVSKMASKLGKDEKSTIAIETLIAARVQVDESGKRIIKNRDGSASTMSDTELEAEIASMVPDLVKGEATTTGGGFSKGSKSNSQAVPKGSDKARAELRNRLKQKGLT